MERIRSQDGTWIAFARSGNGPPLVLVHGSVADHHRWSPVLPVLEDHFTVYAMDRRGRGESSDGALYAIEREFEDIAALVDSIQAPVNLLGHSFGALCALEAARLTSNLRKLILYEPPPPGEADMVPASTAAKMQTGLDAGDHASAVSTFLTEVAAIPPHELELLRAHPSWQGRVAAAPTILREADAIEAHTPFQTEDFATLSVPTLLLLGGDSPPLYRRSIERLHAILPNSQIVILPGQQHVAMNTAPELFTGEVLKFLLETA